MRKHSLPLTTSIVTLLLAVQALRSQSSGAAGDKRPFLGPPPAEEMKVLAPFIGTWKTEIAARPSAETKTGYTARGALTGQSWHNGHFVVLEGFIESAKARIEFTYVMTYDKNKEAYRRWVFSSTGLAVEVPGQWDEKTKTMTWINKVGDETRVTKNVFDETGFVEIQRFTRGDGTLVRDQTMTAVRTPAGGKASNSRAAKEASDSLDGTWDLVSFERDGKETKPQKHTQAIITGEKFVVKADDKIVAAGTSKRDPSAKPKALDTTYTEGPDQGKTFKGIYEINGERLRFCRAGSPDDDRPTEFKTKPGSGAFVSVYRRAKP